MALWSKFMPQSAPSQQPVRISLTFFFFLVGSFLLTLVPHIVELPIWVTVAAVIALVVRSVMEVYRLPLPSTTFCTLVALCLLCGVMLQFKTILGRDAGMAFIAGLLPIKFFELRTPRDIAVIIFSGYFVLMSSLLFSQVVELFLYCLIMMWVLTALLRRLQLGDQPEDRLLPMLRWAGIVFLQALPLTVFLFFFFPRYGEKLQLNMGETALGFTSTVRPGDIASLSQNDAEAMYVSFSSGPIPQVESMYWRGLVLWQYSDGAWTAGDMGLSVETSQPQAVSSGDVIEQIITIAPHYQKWLFALDVPISPAAPESEPQSWSTTFHGDVLQLTGVKSKVDHKERYSVRSSFWTQDVALTEPERRAAVQLPTADAKDAIDERTTKLAEQLRGTTTDTQTYIRTVLRYFRQQHFVYTASPGVHAQGAPWLQEFLFTTRAGFCEHYAAAFAVLMRLQRVPARLVVGYQGATFNPYDNLYRVSQSNAHAWDEVWIDAKVQPDPKKRMGHWQRVDPTAYLPPGDGGQAGGNQQNSGNGGDELAAQAAQRPPSFSETYLPPWLHRSIKEIELRREQLEAQWDDLVFSYDPNTQSRLAEMLGFGRNPAFMLGLGCILTMALCAIITQRWLRRKPALSPVEHLYATFCRNMAQRGIPKALWEGPLAYTGRVAESFPEKNGAIREIGLIVARSRYGPAPHAPGAQAELRALLLLLTAQQAASSSRDQV